jgi:FlaA1/EpsC-like NDP-sugar epimerase
MIRLAGKQPGRDIAIVYTGLRPGEKLHETLFHADERYRVTQHPKILQAEPREVSSLQIEHSIAQLREATASYNREALAIELRNAVPEFQPIGQHAFSQASSTVVAFPARNARKI